MRIKAFIDTNVFVRYLLFLGMEKTKESDEEKKKLWEQYGTKHKKAYEFILNVIKLKHEGIRFVTSPLVISEIFNSLHDEALCRKMWDDGVPLSSWVRQQKKYIHFLTKSEIKEIEKAVDTLESDNLRVIDEYYDMGIVSALILKFRMKTQDSILFSTALRRNCKFFITMDKDFLEKPQLKAKYTRIKIITPEQAVKDFFPEPKDKK